MSLSLTQFGSLFKNLGKILYAGPNALNQVSAIKVNCLYLTDQFAAGSNVNDDFSFNLLLNCAVPFVAGLQSPLAQEQAVVNLVRSAVDNFLVQIAPDIGASSTDTPTSIAGALSDAVAAASGSVNIVTSQTEFQSFALYFNTEYDVALPPSGSMYVTFPDSWIIATVV